MFLKLSQNEIVKCKGQLTLEKLFQIQRNHPMEDEIMHSLLGVGISKAISVLGGADQEVIERTRKFIDVGLRHPSISFQTTCIHSLLYLLQCRQVHKNKSANDIPALFLPVAIEYLRALPLFSTSNQQHEQSLISEDFLGALWALIFYIMEHHSDKMLTSGGLGGSPVTWYKEALQLTIQFVPKAANSSSHGLYLTLMAGLERVVVSKSMSHQHLQEVHEEKSGHTYFRQQILKLCTDLLTESNPVIIIPAVKLFLSCMYSDIPSNSWSTLDINFKTHSIDDSAKCSHPENADGKKEVPLTSKTKEFRLSDDPELLMQTMEQISILFDCVRRSDSRGAQLLCYDILPNILVDFFPVADVINRVINEFISPGQPHQVMLAWVLFAVFKHGAQQDQTKMLQEWVLMALPNFTKRSPISHSVWCLTVFFISAAANNNWLQSMFPHLQQRYGFYQNEEKKLFCVAAKHFYSSLSDPLHKQKFVESFEDVSHPHTPYYDLLKTL